VYIKEVELQSTHNYYHICRNSYMFWLYICSHYQARCKTWNNKTMGIWYNTTGTRSQQSRKELRLQSIHNFSHTCKNSYMFQLCVRSHHQAGYENLNKKTIKKKKKKYKILSPLLYCIFTVFYFIDCNTTSFLYIHILKHNVDVLS
jgi:hypothetical protein